MEPSTFADRVLATGLYPQNVFHQMSLGHSDVSDDDPAPLFDGVEHKVAFIFMSRSGTTFLVDVLNRTGLLGSIKEHMNRYMIRRGGRNWQTDTMRGYVGEAVRRNTTPNGVFGFKGTVEALLPLVQVNEMPRNVHEWHWITARRRDIVGQAVSLYRAKASGVWHNRGRSAEDAAPPPPYDFAGIMKELRLIQQREAQNERFFTDMGLSPLRLVYEDFRNDVVPAVKAVFDHVGVAPPTDLSETARASQFRVMRDDTSRSYADQFRHELEQCMRSPEQQAAR